MAEFFSKTAYGRLPASARKLPKDAQTVCIYLRLRKTEEQIASEMDISMEETTRLVGEVKRTLISSGNYDMVADPVMVSLDADGSEPASNETDMESKVLLSRFISALNEALAFLSQNEKRLLHLFFERNMTGAQILDLCGKSGFLAEGTVVRHPKTESDVYYLLEKILKTLLDKIAENTPIGRGTLTVKGLKEIFSLTGVPG